MASLGQQLRELNMSDFIPVESTISEEHDDQDGSDGDNYHDSSSMVPDEVRPMASAVTKGTSGGFFSMFRSQKHQVRAAFSRPECCPRITRSIPRYFRNEGTEERESRTPEL